jgi:2-C-methyl-D-erythritol 2,4-cyclodiphosphate synthase
VRIGFGYDVHRLQPGRGLVLGGLSIPFHQCLSGWSDADVLLHAVIDAILGAAALGDIGQHFPPGDPRFKGLSSLVMLERVGQLIAERGYTVNNIDSVIIAEQPRLTDYTAGMCANIARILCIEDNKVNIKCCTSEGLGFVGREEGMVAWAVVLLE